MISNKTETTDTGLREVSLRRKTRSSEKSGGAGPKTSHKHMKRNTKDNIQYYLLMTVPILFIFVFSYLPMFGIIIAFQDYIAGRPFFGEGVKWVGLKWFKDFIGSYYFPRIFRNTLVLNIMQLFMGFWVPIVFALIVNEIRPKRFKQFTQTVSYMPYFISSVVVVGMVLSFIASDGIITRLLQAMGFQARSLNANPSVFPWLYTLTSIWKSFGWSSIIYLSTIVSIDPGLYEAASVDGAGRLRKIWHITIPGIMPLVMIQLIMSIGNMLTSNADMILLMYNPSVYKTADVIGTYVYRESLMGGKYSYGTASGLIMSLLNFALLYLANQVCRKKTDYSMW